MKSEEITMARFMDVFAVCNGPLLVGFSWVAMKSPEKVAGE